MKSVTARHIKLDQVLVIGLDIYERDPHKWELIDEDKSEPAPKPELKEEIEDKKAEPELKHKALFICPKCSKEYKSEKAYSKHLGACKI